MVGPHLITVDLVPRLKSRRSECGFVPNIGKSLVPTQSGSQRFDRVLREAGA